MLDMPTFCRNFYASRFLPVMCWEKGELTFSGGLPEGVTVSSEIIERLRSAEKKPAAFTAQDMGLYGIVTAEKYGAYLVLGPAYSVPVTEDILRNFMQVSHVQIKRMEELRPYLSGNPHYSYNRFLSLLVFLHYVLNEEELALTDHFFLSASESVKEISSKQVTSLAAAREEQRQHGTWFFEQRMLDYVRRGNSDELRKFLLNSARQETLNEGKLADDALRQAKNLFIGAVTMVGKSGAIPGGLDTELCYQLIDTYIQECERMNSIDAIKLLQFNMLIDFTSRVAQAQLPQNVSPEVFSCIQFVSTHLCESIGIDDLARHLGRSRGYVTAKIRNELGCTVSEYITRCRMNEARSLLQHTDMSLAEISEYLCFGNQSYFQNVFKKYYGTTPAKYRADNK